MTTVVGVALSIGTAYLATNFNNIMDFLQLVFGFVNAPLFATFLLGMFWKRTTGARAHSAGLLTGTTAAPLPTGLPLPKHNGGWFGVVSSISVRHGAKLLGRHHWPGPSCLVVTFVVSLLTKPETGIGVAQSGVRLYGCAARRAPRRGTNVLFRWPSW